MEVKQTRKDNLPLALLTSFLVLVLCGALWALLYYFGVFSAWIAFIGTFCAGLCYRRFYKKRKALYFVWLFVWSVILNLGAMFGLILYRIHVIEDCTFKETFQYFGYYFGTNLSLLIIDIVFTLIFIIVGAVFAFAIKNVRKKSVNKEDVKIENVQPAQDNKIEEKTAENPFHKIADFCHRKYVELAKLESGERESAKAEFDARYIAKLDAKSKAEMVKHLNSKTYKSPVETFAAEALKKTLLS